MVALCDHARDVDAPSPSRVWVTSPAVRCGPVSCPGLPWRSLLSGLIDANSDLAPQKAAVTLAVYRAIEVTLADENTCTLPVPGIKVTASGKVLTTSCEAMPPNGPQCVDPSAEFTTVNFVPYFLLDDSARQLYVAQSPDACDSVVATLSR